MDALKKTNKLSEYELQRVKNMEDNKLMLSRLMEDLKNFTVPSKAKPKVKRATPKSSIVGEPIRSNPRRAARRFNPIAWSPPRTRSRRGSLSSANSLSEASTPEKSSNHLVVQFGFFNKKRNLDDTDSKDWLDDDGSDAKPRARRITRDVKSVDEITEEDLEMVADSVGDKTYDSVHGTTCHQCRQKTHDMKTICRSGECMGVRGQFCGPCLRNRYGEDARTALTDPEWVCPSCRGICNCSFCRKKAGFHCTGILIHLAREKGYTDVNAYLQSLRRA